MSATRRCPKLDSFSKTNARLFPVKSANIVNNSRIEIAVPPILTIPQNLLRIMRTVASAASYIGSVMVPVLAEKGYDVVGYDAGYYEDCYLVPAPQPLKKQIKKDIRDCTAEDFEGIDYVIHLAGLSNDPLGDFDESLTYEINHKGTMRLAQYAKEAGVKRFAYASSEPSSSPLSTQHRNPPRHTPSLPVPVP